ncbi:unnamed protein product, partial [Amoebophrya sp. A25]
IAWVLDPDACYQVVHNKQESWAERQKKMGKVEKARFNALKVLANFFLAQLEMYAEMTLDRQVNAIGAIEKEYFYELVVCGVWHPTLPEQVRSRFAALTDNLWIDRHPHYEMEVPNYVRRYYGNNTQDMLFNVPRFELLVPPTGA